jgi:hypothetical protein
MRCLNDIISLSLKPLCDSLTPRKGNQAGKQHLTTRHSLNCKPVDAQSLHLAFQDGPRIAAIPKSPWYGWIPR